MKRTFPHWIAATALATLAGGMVTGGAPAFASDGGPKVIKKVAPEFPGEAARKNITDGVVKAKLSIDGAGAVTEVSIVEATPPKAKIFNGAATEALTQWKFEATGKPQTMELKLVFTME